MEYWNCIYMYNLLQLTLLRTLRARLAATHVPNSALKRTLSAFAGMCAYKLRERSGKWRGEKEVGKGFIRQLVSTDILGSSFSQMVTNVHWLKHCQKAGRKRDSILCCLLKITILFRI